ncbi:RNase II stability modulator [compost metagenome]
MGNELGLSTIAEGVETLEQEVILHAFGCKVGQGYRYGKAGPACDFEAALRHRNAA